MLFLDIFSFPAKESQNDSLIYTKVHDIIPASFDLIVGHKSKVSDVIKDFINSKENPTILPEEKIKDQTK